MKLYHMKFTQDKGTTYQIFDVPARSITEAYIELQIRFPSAEITGVELSGKIITITDKIVG